MEKKSAYKSKGSKRNSSGQSKSADLKKTGKAKKIRESRDDAGLASMKTKKGAEDIVALILKDHKPLKKLITIMKDTETEIAERKAAFVEFTALLLAHAKPEEQILYSYMKVNGDLREEAFEGDVEHSLADQMVEEVKRASDEDIWSAKAKVLAELVEHHIEEEEDEILPDFKKSSTMTERQELAEEYILAKGEIEAEGSDDAPSERTIDRHAH